MPLAVLILFTGCHNSSENVQQAPGGQQLGTQESIAPKELVRRVKAIVSAPPISLPIEQEHDGRLVTGYQRFQGEWHIARHWQEQTRYVINITPDWNEPMTRSRMEITPQTQQRAAGNQEFEDAPGLVRSDRAAALLKQIEDQLNATSTGPAGTQK
jgi:hypothetical protein